MNDDQTLVGCLDPQKQRDLVGHIEQSLSKLTPKKKFHNYRYLNSDRLIELTEIIKTGGKPEPGSELETEWMRLNTYDVGRVPGLYGSYIWAKRRAVMELLGLLKNLLLSDHTLSMFIVGRSILEQIATASVLQGEVNKLLELDSYSKDDLYLLLLDIRAVIGKHGKFTRIDWNTYLGKPLNKGRKRSYKKASGTQDLEADSIMKYIDKLNKIVKGTRPAYDFSSEFAHPNIGSFNLYTNRAATANLRGKERYYERYYDLSFPQASIDDLQELTTDFLEMIIKCVDVFDRDLVAMEKQHRKLETWKNKVVKRLVKLHPDSFSATEPCPCMSGFRLSKCCG